MHTEDVNTPAKELFHRIDILSRANTNWITLHCSYCKDCLKVWHSKQPRMLWMFLDTVKSIHLPLHVSHVVKLAIPLFCDISIDPWPSDRIIRMCKSMIRSGEVKWTPDSQGGCIMSPIESHKKAWNWHNFGFWGELVCGLHLCLNPGLTSLFLSWNHAVSSLLI